MRTENIESISPLSPQQQGMLYETVAAAHSGLHVEQEVHALTGTLDLSRLASAWQRVVDRHAMLRTAFVWKGQDQPLQAVIRRVEARIDHEDWRSLPADEQQCRLEAYLEADRRRGFELARPPLVRMALFHTGEDQFTFARTFHHLLMDGWCVPILNRELIAFYQAGRSGDGSHLDAVLGPTRPYRDYVSWLKQQDLAAAEQFWQAELRGLSEPTPLGIEQAAGDELEHGLHAAGSHGRIEVTLPAAETEALRALCRRHRVTLNTLTQGVWALLLSRYSGRDEVVFGTTVSGRPAELPGAEGIIGLFANTLPLRVAIEPRASLWPWLRGIQERHLELRAFDYCSAGQVQRWSGLPGGAPLFESILVYENYPTGAPDDGSELRVGTLRQARYIGAQTRYPLALLLDGDGELLIRLVYDRRRFDEGSADRIAAHWIALLRFVAAEAEPVLGVLRDRIMHAEIPRLRPRRPLRHAERQQPESDPSAATPTEAILAGVWASVLGIDAVDVQESFYDLGGHSLLAAQITARARELFQVELPLGCLLEHPTVAGFARQVEAAQRGQRGTSARGGRIAPGIPVVDRNGDLPLSFAQQRLWFTDQLAPGSPVFNSAASVRIEGPLDAAALEAGLNEIVRRHEALRTTFPPVDGKPVQRIAPALALTVPVEDLSGLPPARAVAEAERLTAEEAARPFDLVDGPLLRAALLRLAPEEHRLLLTMHHIISDRWSLDVLFRELGAHYEAIRAGKPSTLPPLPIQYADYAVWQREWLQGEVLDQQLAYWTRQLAGRPPVLDLPADMPRQERLVHRGAAHSLTIARELTHDLQRLSRQEGVTLYMTLLAAFMLLLRQVTGETDLVLGTNSAGRDRVELEGLIGFFINQLSLRADLSGNPTFRELLRRVRVASLGAYAHDALPFDRLVAALRPDRDLTHTPLFRVLFVQNGPLPPREFDGLKMSAPVIDAGHSKYDLAVFIEPTGDELAGTWVYKADLFHAATIARLADQFHRLLAGAAAQPETRLDELGNRLEGREKEQKMVEKQEREQSHLQRFKNIRARPVSLAEGQLVRTDPLQPGESLPLAIRPALDGIDLAEWARNNREFIETRLLKHGGLLFRGFGVDSIGGFEQFTTALCDELFGEYGDLPRAGVSGKIYTSTPYPEDQAILYHNESSHMHQWPLRIWFFCVQPAAQGGETPIVDCRRIYQELDPAIREPFARKGVMYVRNFTEELDVSWQSFFQTEDRAVVEAYCRGAGIQLEWKAGGLRTRQLRQAVTRHPHSGEMLFFNQIQLHHVSCLDPAVRESLTAMFSEEDLPRNVYYGDGTPIEDAVMAEIAEVYRRCTVQFPWEKGDIVMLDNMIVAHARNPYAGPRKIVVAMGEMFAGSGK